MDKSEAIEGVAEELRKTEQAVDAAIAHATSMVQSMIAGRAELNLSPVTFTESQAKAMEVIAALSAARTVAVETHHCMAKDHRRMGWGVYATGPHDKGDDTPIGNRTQGHLRVAS